MSDKVTKNLIGGKGRIITDPEEIRASIIVNNEDPSKRVSESYDLIPTAQILDTFADHGWTPNSMKIRKSRKEEAAKTGKHIIRLSHPDYQLPNKIGDLNLMLRNSHDGTSSLIMGIGSFIFACENGLISGSVIGVCRILHKKVNPESIALGIQENLERADRYIEQINDWQGIELQPAAAAEFARQAAAIRWPDARLQASDDLLKVRRQSDDGNSLWSIYNRVQENATLGDVRLLKDGKDEEGRHFVISRKARPLIGAEADYAFNERLSDLAYEFASAAA